MTKLIIAEKPSVAKNISDALKINQRKDGYYEGKDFIVTWAFGHLLQLYDAKDYDSKMAKWQMNNFPFIPKQFKYKVKCDPAHKDKNDKGAEKQISIIKSLVNREEVEGIISACDFDREGQIIGDILIKYLGTNKPVYRLLLNEWTAEEVLKGLKSIKPNEQMQCLRDAGISRQWADWILGINLTTVTTLKFQTGKNGPLNIGRVLLPTLKIIYDRDKEIQNFIPENYFKLSADFKTVANKEYEGTYIEDNVEKFEDKSKLDHIKKLIEDKNGIIVDKQVEKKKEYPPYLFNLSNLQGYVTSKYKGWTSDKVLKVAQSLYEKKFITYPRTASVVLEESLAERAEKVLNLLKMGLPYEKEVRFQVTKRIFDNSKVESHSAITPTYMMPKGLTADELIVYTAIKNRFIMQFMPVAEFEETVIITKVNEAEIKGVFSSKGKVQLVEGWKKVEKIESKDTILPLVQINEKVDLVQSKISKHTTKPPKYHTEKTLLRVMETCGKGYKDEENEEVESEDMMNAILSGFSIGTPATRAETIKKLKDVGYIYSKEKNLMCTELGKKLIEIFPVKDLLDLEYTGRLEKTLYDMEKGKVQKAQFLSHICKFTYNAVMNIKNDKNKLIYANTSEVKPKEASKSKEDKLALESLGKCPLCGNDIIEGKKGFGCSNWKSGCKFVLWKEDKYLETLKKKITKTMVKKLLKDGKVSSKGLTDKNGKKFSADLSYEKSKDSNNFSWRINNISYE